MELLGNNLEQQFNACSRKFSLRTVLLLADQMLERISDLHKKGYLHRNIRPESFLIGGEDNKDMLYLVDFGLSKKYVKDGKAIPFKKGRKMTGTLRFASINSQLGLEQARRDDLESIGYVLVYFLKGELPWQSVVAGSKEDKNKAVLKMKLETQVNTLTKGLPEAFKDYLNSVRCMNYDTEPEYGKYRKMFKAVLKNKLDESEGFDWHRADEPVEEDSELEDSDSNDSSFDPMESKLREFQYQKIQKELKRTDNNQSVMKNNNSESASSCSDISDEEDMENKLFWESSKNNIRINSHIFKDQGQNEVVVHVTKPKPCSLFVNNKPSFGKHESGKES